jgi:hypothetical protein
MLWKVGAGKTEPVMELTYTTPGVTDVYKTLSETMRQPNLMVNLDGKRFINEEIMNNTVFTGNAISRQRDRVAFTIINDEILDSYRKTGLDYSAWECKYHVVWIPKCRKKQLYGGVAKYLGSIFHRLAKERESRIVEGHLCHGPCAYADRDTPEIRCSPSGGI